MKVHKRFREFERKLRRFADPLRAIKLDGLLMCTLTKLPHVKYDLVRTDDNCEEWKMNNLISYLQK